MLPSLVVSLLLALQAAAASQQSTANSAFAVVKNDTALIADISTLMDLVMNAAGNLTSSECTEEVKLFINDTSQVLKTEGPTAKFIGYFNDILIVAGNDSSTADFRNFTLSVRSDINSRMTASYEKISGESPKSSAASMQATSALTLLLFIGAAIVFEL